MPSTIGFAGSLERCREWLREELKDGPKLRLALVRAAKSQGYNESNIDVAARQLRLVSDRVRVEGMGWRSQWSLPQSDPEAPRLPPPEPSRAIPMSDENPTQLSEQLQAIQQQNRLVDIFRYVDGEPGFLDSLPGQECTLRSIKRRFGGGRYMVEGVTFVIEGPPLSGDGEHVTLRPRGSQVVPTAPAGAPSGGFDMAALLVALIKQQGDMLTAVLTRGSGSDPVAMFKAVDDAVARRLTNAPSGPVTPVDQALQLLREGMSLGRGMAEGQDPDEGRFSRTVEKVAPFLNALAHRLGPAGSPANATPAVDAPAATSPAREGIAVTALQQVLVDLAPALPQLLDEAKRGTAPDSVATWILENATDDQYAALAEASESPQFVEDVMEALARRAPQAGWAMGWLKDTTTRLNELLAADRRDESAGRDDNGSAPDGAAGAGGGGTADRAG